TTLFNIVTLVINWWYCKHKLKIKVIFGRFKWDFMREVAVYSFWIFLNAIMDRIYWSTGQFVLGMYSGAMAVAVYAIAIQLQSIYMSFSCAISGVFLPKVTAMVTKSNNEKEISDLFIRTGRIQYIVMVFILTSFIIFGRQFILLWAGPAYEDAYLIALLFFMPLTIPLIQNLGITILQARNQMKFRSLLYIFIAVGSLGISIPLAKMYGGIGCAVGTAIALTLGQIIVMNIYYHKKIHLNILLFWKEIGKMSITPIIIGCVSFYVLSDFPNLTILSLTLAILLFVCAYIPIYWFSGMNKYERDLFAAPIINLYHKIK
ncbi:MAG: oligosaccharide flippase family protein, partial [Bacteroidaceae bacterium]